MPKLTPDQIADLCAIIYGADWSQAQLARDLGQTRDTVSRNLNTAPSQQFSTAVLLLAGAKVTDLRQRADQLQALRDVISSAQA